MICEKMITMFAFQILQTTLYINTLLHYNSQSFMLNHGKSKISYFVGRRCVIDIDMCGLGGTMP